MTTVEDENIEIELMLEALYRKYGYDFRNYASHSLERRIRHRLSLSGLKTISEMQHRLLHDPEFVELLLKDLSITVTEMFRDPEFYVAVREKVVPELRVKPFIKVWHAGCATAEEVYSMAILFKEEGVYDRTRIYATDFNEAVLDSGREGIFQLSRMRQYVTNYIQSGGHRDFVDYYTARYDAAIMDTSLKSNMTFSNHNLVTDGSFGMMDMIVCRNVLIYFNKTLQNRVIGLFSESLCEGGFLCLGSKESIRFTEYSDLFQEVSGENRIYRKVTKGIDGMGDKDQHQNSRTGR